MLVYLAWTWKWKIGKNISRTRTGKQETGSPIRQPSSAGLMKNRTGQDSRKIPHPSLWFGKTEKHPIPDNKIDDKNRSVDKRDKAGGRIDEKQDNAWNGFIHSIQQQDQDPQIQKSKIIISLFIQSFWRRSALHTGLRCVHILCVPVRAALRTRRAPAATLARTAPSAPRVPHPHTPGAGQRLRASASLCRAHTVAAKRAHGGGARRTRGRRWRGVTFGDTTFVARRHTPAASGTRLPAKRILLACVRAHWRARRTRTPRHHINQ